MLIIIAAFYVTVKTLLNQKKLSQIKSDFINNMTHEFKTPLTNIALASKMMVKDSNIKQEDKIRHYSGIILQENEKLRIQVEQVLSMTALERGEIPLTKTPLDFHHLINEAVKCIGVQIENKHGVLKLDLNATKYYILGDKNHLTNVLCNLIDNSIKYSKESPSINIGTKNSDQKFILTVSDRGIGIEKEYLNKIFVKFFRVPTGNLHDVKGFGLGLAYVKKIVELHGGIIELHSKIGEGTIFTITLPLNNE